MLIPNAKMSTQITRRSPGILIALAFCIALQMMSFAMILPLFARRFESFGMGVGALGVSAMAYALSSAFLAPFIGMLADRFGRRPVILFTLTGFVITYCGYLFASSAWMLILLRGLAGVFTAGLLPAMMSIVGDLAPENRRGQWIGIVNGGGAAAGWIVGPFLGGLLYDHYGYVAPFVVAVGMSVGALLLAVFLIPETHAPVAHPDRPRLAWLQELIALPARSTLLMLLLITFGVMFAWAFIEPQFMFYAYDDLSWTSSQLGLVMSAFGFAFMFGEFALGRLSDRRGRKPILVLGLALFAAQFIGLVIFRDAIWIAASFILAGLGNGLYDPALNAYILDITPPEHTASMIGLKSTAGSLGNLLGPALVVLVAPLVAPQVVFLIAAALIILLTLVAGLFLRPPANVAASDRFSAAAYER
jgi:MFS transporter, DHA1 family, multidrug resistance protein